MTSVTMIVLVLTIVWAPLILSTGSAGISVPDHISTDIAGISAFSSPASGEDVTYRPVHYPLEKDANNATMKIQNSSLVLETGTGNQSTLRTNGSHSSPASDIEDVGKRSNSTDEPMELVSKTKEYYSISFLLIVLGGIFVAMFSNCGCRILVSAMPSSNHAISNASSDVVSSIHELVNVAPPDVGVDNYVAESTV